METESHEEKTQNLTAVKLSEGSVNFKDVDFSIDDTKILDKINLSIKNGDKIGLVGNIGSGKTTLLRLLVGFYQPTSGNITVGGYDLNNIPAKNLRDHIGYCGQKVQLSSASIYENIIAGFSEASEEDVIEAAKLSCAHDFIALLPGGYNYSLSEGGSNLSGGQRQAIALARCFIRKPKMLVLDEPTSAMDGQTEQKIITNLLNLDYNPTIVISTHRTNHLSEVDKIGILIDGKLARFDDKNKILTQQVPAS